EGARSGSIVANTAGSAGSPFSSTSAKPKPDARGLRLRVCAEPPVGDDHLPAVPPPHEPVAGEPAALALHFVALRRHPVEAALHLPARPVRLHNDPLPASAQHQRGRYDLAARRVN